MELPPHLRDALDQLLARPGDEIPLDAIGEAIGAGAVDTAQIEELLAALERAGRKIVAPSGAQGVAALRKVVPAARALAGELGRTARVAEIAERTGLSEDEVRRALLLAKVMGR